MLAGRKVPAKALGLPCPRSAWLERRGCRLWPGAEAFRLAPVRGLGWDPGPAQPWAFLWGPSQLGGVMKGLGATLPSAHECPGGTLPLLLLLPSPCPPRFPFSRRTRG